MLVFLEVIKYRQNVFKEIKNLLSKKSKQTKNIVKNVLKDHPKEDWAIQYVPHGINEQKFYPILRWVI